MITAVQDRPRVSVIVPVLNGRDYIHEALASILDQRFADLELIVVDDGSTDFDYNSLKDLDPRVRVLRLTGVGVSAARNEGIAQARGELLAFLDADDVWAPGKLEAQVRHLDAYPEVGVVFGRFVRWRAQDSGHFPAAATLVGDCAAASQIDPERSGWIYDKLLMGLLVGMNSAMVRATIARRLGGFDDSLRIGEDYDFWLRASRITPMHALDANVALYRIHERSAMHNLDAENQMARVLRANYLRWGGRSPCGGKLSDRQFRFRLAQSEFDHGYKHYWEGSPAVAARAFSRSVAGGYKPVRSMVYVILSTVKCLFVRA